MDNIKSLYAFLLIIGIWGTVLYGVDNTVDADTVKTENIHDMSKDNDSSFKNKLRDYDGTLFENMFIYGIIMNPKNQTI